MCAPASLIAAAMLLYGDAQWQSLLSVRLGKPRNSLSSLLTDFSPSRRNLPAPTSPTPELNHQIALLGVVHTEHRSKAR
jgi:hypothetical protein